MAFTAVSTSGAFTGATPVTIIDDPGVGVVRTLKTLVIRNRDTVARTITLLFDAIDFVEVTLEAGEQMVWADVLAVGNGQALSAASDDTAATVEPSFVCSYGEES